MNFSSTPKFYLVGAPKAGSSALSNFLAQHPQITMCRIKEPNFHCIDTSDKIERPAFFGSWDSETEFSPYP